MFKVKKQFSSIIYICLISFIGLLFIINNNKVMAMNKNNSEIKIRKNKGKQIANNVPITKEVDEFFQLLQKAKKNIQQIRENNPFLHKASVEEIEEHISLSIKRESEYIKKSIKNRKKIDLEDLDFNTIPKEKQL
ncbi:hypothetical protein FEF22_000600 [Texas Phoenix palm phytoplasma]|uniref:Sequence-variable mosaic (SVM) signal sequence domain-containing protein n=1 Tax=Texas Phoenix palm phytoplasma TaxID=176709 RepID=A0ABS5BI78_9MOLU|nr:SVM family protein [Texas Phoenix palm phytoplasma]MBP3059288.1 hypothetical protein [Texas Phoenix palm phytoplasma]